METSNIKINSCMKLISIIMISILLLSCNKEKQEYIEVSLGFSMDPNEPRIGILINDKDSLYVCKENLISVDNGVKYKYFKSTQKIDFASYKKRILNSFYDSIQFKSTPDAQPRQINYYLNGKNLKFRFYSHELSKRQEEIIEDLILLKEDKRLKEIPYHKFSRDLLDSKIPNPPFPPK
ncbi:hypothetical protein BBI01_05755 [Chryseobacterium artocarpi]|uniref:Lipoprotein n=2 Tax=Chryseobacterium artocarpi TaxID=1414727 RepID=A0A1B8ZX62_9FLAO|nr:hypothetical protein BBI01_05755 [Chryseobacterium artocarpi]